MECLSRRPTLGPLCPNVFSVVRNFLRGIFRNRFLHALRAGKHISPSRLADLLSWKHSGFNIHDGGEKSVPSHDTEGRKRLSEYLLRHPFSLQKITWNANTQTVIYRSKRRNGKHLKSIWTTVASWFSNTPEKGARASRLFSNKNRRQK